MGRGILIFAKNNEQINYIKQAKVCATLAKYYLDNIPVCLITDTLISDPVFDIVKVFDNFKSQKRRYSSSKTFVELSYFNIGRTSAYDLSPFDETLLIDSDYFIQNSNLDLVWGTDQELLMNTGYCGIFNPKNQNIERYLGRWGPNLYWATLVFFKKSCKAEVFFNLTKYIEENYDFYTASYNLPGVVVRNDFIFSIAAHLLGGILPLPVPSILNSFETDELLSVDKNTMLFLCDRKDFGHVHSVRVNDLNVHMMNKLDLNEKTDWFLRVYNV
ncbi:MAG: hypothetical protein HC836_10840 [Richelia sp. RM2_1_2]|nr:hypothetical protein [Richelia sp. RM2_1_2]